MLGLVRIALQLVLFFVLLSVVIGIGSGNTGAAEKVVLVALAALAVWAAPQLRRIGRTPRQSRPIP